MSKKKKKSKKKKNKSNIYLILDRSGSMATIKEDTVGGVNTFIEDQKKEPGKAKLTLVKFDHEYEVVLDRVKLSKVEKIDLEPRGSTALLDAIGKTINSVPEKDLDKNNIFVIVTDGMENASIEFNNEQIRQLIEDRQNRGWTFIYLGANQDSFAVAGNMGILSSNVSNYATTTADILDKYKNVSRVTKVARGNKACGQMGFTSQELKTKS